VAGTAAVLAAALALTGVGASSTVPRPHDRALVKQLVTQVNTFSALSSSTSDDKALKKCSFLKKNPAQAFAAVIAILPALLIEVVGQNKPQFVKLRGELAAMHPDSTLFRQWLGAEVKSLDLLLLFDNGGKPVDLCKAAQVMLSKKSTAADVHAVLGIDPALVAKLYQSGESGAGRMLTKLNPKMRTFFISAGMTPKQAKVLTS
jgi:hypothetical protein